MNSTAITTGLSTHVYVYVVPFARGPERVAQVGKVDGEGGAVRERGRGVVRVERGEERVGVRARGELGVGGEERGVVRHGQFRGVRSGGRAGTARHCRTARKGPLVGALRVPVHVVGRALQDCRVYLFRRPPVHKAKERDSESSEQFTEERNMQIHHPREIDR